MLIPMIVFLNCFLARLLQKVIRRELLSIIFESKFAISGLIGLNMKNRNYCENREKTILFLIPDKNTSIRKVKNKSVWGCQ